jgi:hypothetical protein
LLGWCEKGDERGEGGDEHGHGTESHDRRLYPEWRAIAAGAGSSQSFSRATDYNFLTGREAKAKANLWTPGSNFGSNDPPGFFIWSVLYAAGAVRGLARRLTSVGTA